MEHKELLRKLKKRGIIHQEQSDFAGVIPGIKNCTRIVCAERENEKSLSGISFWLFGEGAHWFIGLWSGIYFQITNPEVIDTMAWEFLSRNEGRITGDIPVDVRKKYGLILIEPTPENSK